jgi:hypothetical protein
MMKLSIPDGAAANEVDSVFGDLLRRHKLVGLRERDASSTKLLESTVLPGIWRGLKDDLYSFSLETALGCNRTWKLGRS